jgi:hypothetical protein
VLWKCLDHLAGERAAWREERAAFTQAVLQALDNNSKVMESHAKSMTSQAETLRTLIQVIEDHDRMSREAIARLEHGK